MFLPHYYSVDTFNPKFFDLVVMIPTDKKRSVFIPEVSKIYGTAPIKQTLCKRQYHHINGDVIENMEWVHDWTLKSEINDNQLSELKKLYI